MNAKAGFYSVIQFRPSELREEGVNVGLITGLESEGQLDVRFAKTNEHLKRTFGARAIDDARVASSKGALARRLSQLGRASEEALRDFSGKESGQLVILPPRPLLVTDAQVEIDALYRELVGEELEPRRRRTKRRPDIESHFQRIENVAPLRRDIEVAVPVLRRPLRADYAYKNGVMNLIKGEGFAADPIRATTSAVRLGTQGLMLSKHPSRDGLGYKLVVIADFEDSSVAADVETVLRDHSVRVVRMQDVDEYVEEVRREAHE